MSGEWLLVKRDLYYRPGSIGYTGIRDNAGRFSHEEASKIAGNEVSMVRLEDAPEFTNACFDDLARNHLIKQREHLTAENERLKQVMCEAMDPTLDKHDIRATIAGGLDWTGPVIIHR